MLSWEYIAGFFDGETIDRLEELMEMAENGELVSPRATITYMQLRKVG